MRDVYTHTEADAGRFEAQHADRDRSEYDAAEEGPIRTPPISDDVRAGVRAAYVNAGLMFPCKCGGSFWSRQALEVHREKRHQ